MRRGLNRKQRTKKKRRRTERRGEESKQTFLPPSCLGPDVHAFLRLARPRRPDRLSSHQQFHKQFGREGLVLREKKGEHERDQRGARERIEGRGGVLTDLDIVKNKIFDWWRLLFRARR
jgi:hypothetical protein